MKRIKPAIVLLILATITINSCRKDNGKIFSRKIKDIENDIDLYDDKTYIIDSDIDNITGSICIGGNTTLIIEDANLNFNLTEDLQYGIYLEDNAKIIIKNSTIESENKMWEFELRNNASIDVSDSELKNHSAVKLFDNCILNGTNSLIEELRMDNKAIATINNCEIYPNMQFFFNTNSTLEFPESYTSVNFVLDNSAYGGWKLDMSNSIAQGWQVDVKPNTNITIQNSIDVTLALWSDGTVNDSIHIVNPESTLTNFTITEFGSVVNIINSEVYFINIYLKSNDKLIISGEKLGTTYNTMFLEIVLNDNAEMTIYDSHVFGQLFHINDNAKLTVKNCLIGSDDPEDPINSEFGIKDNSHAYAFDCDILNSDIVINGTSILEVTNCMYNTNRVFISENGQLIVH